MSRRTVAILGGYGVFGRRIAASLLRHPELDLIIAGRDLATARALVNELGGAAARPLQVDCGNSADVDRLIAERPAVIIDTVGPFHLRGLGLARRCAERGIHFVDIADSREHVGSVIELDTLARANGVAVISGASTVPAFSTAIVDDLAADGRTVVEIDVGITPGHRAPRGLATVRSILVKCGKPIPAVCGQESEFGWGDRVSHFYPAPVGRRWLSNVDTPERALWAARYPSLRRASIKAGLAIGWMHLGVSLLSRGVRLGLLPSLDRFSRGLLWIANRFGRFGDDSGAMHVRVLLRDSAGIESVRTGTVVAERGDGPQIPAAPAALVAKKLLGLPSYAPMAFRGAMPCCGLLTRTEILAELGGFAIRYSCDGR